MDDIVVEQAVLHRNVDDQIDLLASSPGFLEEWQSEARELILEFGSRPPGVACPHALFAVLFEARWVAVVQVADRDGGLSFHFLIIDQPNWEGFLGDPFAVARKFPPPWIAKGGLPQLKLPLDFQKPRTVDEVRKVLERLKAHALPEDVDPESLTLERTVENSESPAMLGATQVLVDGGKVVFERAQPDSALLEGLWTLLPHSTRAHLWPATFAFSNALHFDALVVPRLNIGDFDGYTNETQAADYPEGYYELHLQMAAENNDQAALDRLMSRRSLGQTKKLAYILCGFMLAMVLFLKVMEGISPRPEPPVDLRDRVAVAAGSVAAGDPWTAITILHYGYTRWAPKEAGK